MAAGLTGLVGADMLGGAAGKYLGRASDYLTGMRPKPEALNEKFMARLKPKADALRAANPNLDEYTAMSQAANELFTEMPEYASNFE
jgi:hypothetical protein